MYLGNQMVSPVIIQGSGSSETFCRYKIENGIVSTEELDGDIFKDIVEITDSAFMNAFSGYGGLGIINFQSLKYVDEYGLYKTFSDCEEVESARLPLLKTVGEYGLFSSFNNSEINSIDLSSLESVATNGLSQFIQRCVWISEVRLQSLKSIGMYGLIGAFHGCYSLSDVYLNSLVSIHRYAFINMFDNDTGLYPGTCTVHLPSNLQGTIATLIGYPTFGGNSSRIVLAFDLPATS